MQRSLVDIALLLLLILFFGVQQRSSGALHFRLWLFAWIFGLMSFATGMLPLVGSEPMAAQVSIRWDFALLGSVTFAMSFLKMARGLRQALLHILAVGAMLGGAVDLILFVDTPSLARRWACVLLLVLGHALLVWLVLREMPRARRWGRTAVVSLGTVFCSANAVEFLRHPRKDLGDWLSAEMYVCAAIAFAVYANRSGRRLIGALGVVGFVAWSGFCLAHFFLSEESPVMVGLYSAWTIPKYFVAFSMILMAFEEANREKNRLMVATQTLYEDFRLLYEDHPHPMWIVDAATGRFVSFNQAGLSAYGFLDDTWLTMQPRDLEIPGNVEEEEMLRLPPLSVSGIVRRHRYGDGKPAWVSLMDRDIVFQGRMACLVIALDITEQLQVGMDLNHRANHDALTGLPNRHLLEERFSACLESSAREGQKAALLAIDIDHFKKVNDTYGHATGDACLKAVAARLQSRIRQVDTIARIGGEEFVAVVGRLQTAEDVQKVADTLLRQFERPIKLEGLELTVTVSIGVAIYPDDGMQAAELHARADEALYAAKRGGRNRVVMAQSTVSAMLD